MVITFENLKENSSQFVIFFHMNISSINFWVSVLRHSIFGGVRNLGSEEQMLVYHLGKIRQN